MLVELIERIAQREGIGQLLAGGSRSAAAQLGKGENLAIQVKGLELAMHHPRAMRGLEISYASGARGASHNEGGSVHKDGITIDERAAAIAASVDRAMVNGSAVWCSFTVGPLSNADAAAVLHAATGHAFDEQELMVAGQRIWHLRRVFNLKHCGIAGEADVLPSRVMAQLPETPAFPDLLAAYYRARGLDSEGTARRERLAELGLSAEADDLGLAG
jgi:aldehyde:ferredoxin oxidoreductase